jgi:hypothetical protein
MRLLKQTDEYRVENEIEAKEMMEKFRTEAHEEGYTIGKMGYTLKTKKSKGEIIDEGCLLTVQKVFGAFFD